LRSPLWFSRDVSSRQFLHDRLGGMDTDKFQPASTHILEPMWNIGGRDNDIPGMSSRGTVTHGELSLALPDNPGLRIRMYVQSRSPTRLGINQEERNGASEIAPFEANRTALTGMGFLVAADL